MQKLMKLSAARRKTLPYLEACRALGGHISFACLDSLTHREIELNKTFWALRSPLLGTQVLLGTLRFKCSSDASQASHKKLEAKWDRCGGERVKRPCPLRGFYGFVVCFHDSVRTLHFMAFRLVSQTVCQMTFTMQPGLSFQAIQGTLLDDCKNKYQEILLL